MTRSCWSSLGLPLLLLACTYQAPIRPVEWYENPQHYPDDSAAHPRREALQSYLDRAVKEGLPGAALLVRTPEEGTWVGAAGYVDIASGVKWAPSTIGRVGSVTKLFAASVILKLAEQSLLTLDAPAGQYLPKDVVDHVANAGTATVRQLLHHTSGVFDYLKSSELLLDALGRYDYRYQPKEKLLEHAYGKTPDFPPGMGWSYSNTNFLLLELIAERVSARSGEALLDEMVIRPLGLRSTSYHPGGEPPRGMARGYADVFADGKLIDVTDNQLERFHYDGGVISNINDLASFLEGLLAGPFLEEATRSALLDVVPTRGNSPRGTDFYGTGLILEQHPKFGPVYGHSGTALGFSAHVYHLPRSKVTFAALVNASQHTMEERSYRWFSPLKVDTILELVVPTP
jgi:D-alanyl-D-alanine carboxypeptidase